MPSKSAKRNNTSKKSASSRGSASPPRAPFQEPLPSPPSPWKQVGMSEEEYKASLERIAKRIEEWRKEAVQDYLESEWNSVSYWESRLDFLERSRGRYVKVRGWSADIIEEVDAIDEAISECLERLDEIWDYQDRLEVEYD